MRTKEVILFLLLPVYFSTLAVASQETVTISSSSPLIEIAVLIRAGSIHDPLGKEGLAYLTAWTLLQGASGDQKKPLTKDELALMTRRWGARARPSVGVQKEVTTFYATVPEEVLDNYLNEVFRPLFAHPLFHEQELERLRRETLEHVSGALRYEDIESLGLNAIDHYIFKGTRFAHLPEGSIQGLKNITRKDVLSFYAAYYRPNNLIIGLSKEDASLREKVRLVLQEMGTGVKVSSLEGLADQKPERVEGRHVVIIALPNAQSTGLHAAFPIFVNRKDPDYWPLYVANVFLGAELMSRSV